MKTKGGPAASVAGDKTLGFSVSLAQSVLLAREWGAGEGCGEGTASTGS